MSNTTEYGIKYIGKLEGHTKAVTSLACGKDEDGEIILISGSRDKSIIIWDLNLNVEEEQDKENVLAGRPRKSLLGHNHFVSSLALSSDCSKLVSGSWDKTARLWDLNSYRCERLLSGHTKDILSVAFSHDERMIFTGSMDNSLKYWNTMGQCKYTNNQFGGWVSSIININKAKEGNMVAVGTWDSRVHIFNSDYENFAEIHDGNDYAVTSMSVDEYGDFLFVAYKNGKIQVYNIKDSKSEEKYVLKQEIETGVDINGILFESKYLELFLIATSKGLQIRKIKGDGPLFEYPVLEEGKKQSLNNACNCLIYEPNKEYLFAGFNDGTIRVFRFVPSN